MPPARVSPPRPLGAVIGAAVLTGVFAGFSAGAIDAVASWRQAHQFAPHILTRVRFVLFSGFSHALAGFAVGLGLAIVLLVLSRATRLGDMIRFGWRDHAERRAREPRQAVAGLGIALAALPCLGLALYVAYRATVPFVSNRHVITLEVLVAMSATVGALVAAVPLTFVVARPLELGLQRAAKWKRVGRVISSPWAPFVAAGILIGAALGVWAKLQWDTARLLPLRGPLIAVLGLVLALPASRPARRIVAFMGPLFVWFRLAVWVGLPLVLLVLVLVTGGSASVIKAISAYTGLGGPIAHQLRRVFDGDHDGYSRFLGGGDCDDHDPGVHPGAPEIPDDGIDQNCIGGDASPKTYPPEPVAFAKPVPPEVPNDFDILLVTIDTTRADHLHAYGYERQTSPSLDQLAKEGTLFENGWAHAPSTRYSMPAILTGRLPLDVYYDTTVEGWPGLLPKATTIAESLKPLGFFTGAITNYWYFDRSRHMDQGFDEYDNEDARLHGAVAGAGPERTRGSSSKEQTDKAIKFVDKHAGERWFLWVHYYDPHADYEAHPDLPASAFGTKELDLYDGEIRFTDFHIGRLFDELRAKGLYDKTVVVVTGDHGEGFGEHNVPHHGYHLYAAQTKVPMIYRVPGLKAHPSTTPAGHDDIVPTLVNLAGGEPTKDMMGRSLVDVLAGAPDRDRTIFQQLSYENNHEMRAGVSQHCHVIYNVSPDTSWEVYRIDRDQDPMETEDLANDDDVCKETRENVEHWYDISQIPPGAAEALLPGKPANTSLDIKLGDAVRLLAVDAPAHAKPGDTIELTWTFEALGPVEAGWKVFAHLDGPNKVLYNGDHAPARPFEWWKQNDFIRYTTTISLPKAAPIGHYVLTTGLWDGKKRIDAKASPPTKITDNGAEVATIEVSP